MATEYPSINMMAVFTYVKKAILASFPNARVLNTRESNSPSFPCVQIIVANRIRTQENITLDWDDGQYQTTFLVEIYSNAKKNPAKECMDIADVVTDAFSQLHYRLSFFQQIDNIDPSVCRFTARFEGRSLIGETISIN